MLIATSAAEIFAPIGGISAAIAALAALVGLGLSKRSLEAARQTVTLAAQAQRDADESRRESEHDRRRRRLERIGELVEDLFWATEPDARYTPPAPPQGNYWMDARNRLAHAIIGFAELVPSVASATNAATYDQAHAAASQARAEVEAALRRDFD